MSKITLFPPLTRKKASVLPDRREPYLIFVCLAKSSAVSIGESMRSTCEKISWNVWEVFSKFFLPSRKPRDWRCRRRSWWAWRTTTSLPPCGWRRLWTISLYDTRRGVPQSTKCPIYSQVQIRRSGLLPHFFEIKKHFACNSRLRLRKNRMFLNFCVFHRNEMKVVSSSAKMSTFRSGVFFRRNAALC